LEDPWIEPPEEAYDWTVNAKDAPDQSTYLEIYFEKGVPVSIDGKRYLYLNSF